MHSEPRIRGIRHGHADSTSPERVGMAVGTSHEEYLKSLREENVVCIGPPSWEVVAAPGGQSLNRDTESGLSK